MSLTQLKTWHKQKLRIGFVPTMGNLHAGHLSLVELAKKHCDKVVVSVFVNQLQFGPNEDFATYPRTLETDIEKLEKLQVDLIYQPSTADIYPHSPALHTFVEVPEIGKDLCGITRPQFFRGICTVVTKLFNLIQPDIAVFGEKDYQQLVIIKKMVADLAMQIEIISGPTVREANGLAMSSRNQYLDPEQFDRAATLHQALQETAELLRSNKVDFTEICTAAEKKLVQSGFQVDYFTVRRNSDLKPACEKDSALRILAAVFLGKTRLIDNEFLAI